MKAYILAKWNTLQIFPPGYEYEKTYQRFLIFWSIAAAYSIRFFFDYAQARGNLFITTWVWKGNRQELTKVLREGAVIQPFSEIAVDCFLFFVPLIVLLIIEGITQYLYYFQESRSILLVKRMGERSFLWKTCVLGPVIGGLILCITIAVLSLMYYGVYVGFTPKGCLP